MHRLTFVRGLWPLTWTSSLLWGTLGCAASHAPRVSSPDSSLPKGRGDEGGEAPTTTTKGGTVAAGEPVARANGPAGATSQVEEPSALREASSPETESIGRLEDGRVGRPEQALPSFRIRHIGMHIGGESNSDEAKRPWLRAIEKQESPLLVCYRLVNKPLAGGTLGVDLYVTSAGGRPEVRKVRQRLGGDDFEGCVRSAFEGIRFAPPSRPTVLSYSLRFDIQGI